MARAKTAVAGWTREGVKRRLLARFWTRFHMSLILLSCGLAAMLANWSLRQLGVDAMLVRYPVAVFVSYAVFLAGVWTWLRYVGIEAPEEDKHGRSLLDHADIPDIPLRGGAPTGGGSGGGNLISSKGGSFDGGGASASWADGAGARVPVSNLNAQALAASSSGDSSGSAGVGDLLEGGGDDFALVLLAIAVVAAIVLSSGYLVYMAPDILAEAAFGALLAGGLARRSKHEDAIGWVAGVIKKTWWPFAMVLVLALGFAGYAAKHHPQAKTFKQALEAAAAPPP